MNILPDKAVAMRKEVSVIIHQFRKADSESAASPLCGTLNVAEVHVIEYLGDTGPHMMRELAEYLIVPVNSMNNMIDNLEKKGFAKRLRDDDDRRIVRVELTAEGQAAYREIVNEELRLCAQMLGTLTADEQDIFMVLMRKIARGGK